MSRHRVAESHSSAAITLYTPAILQAAMGWEDNHLRYFGIEEIRAAHELGAPSIAVDVDFEDRGVVDQAVDHRDGDGVVAYD